MFFIFTKKEKKVIINENNECLLCLESNNKVFYDYDYENNKYIHKNTQISSTLLFNHADFLK